jgi:hypothetical protein
MTKLIKNMMKGAVTAFSISPPAKRRSPQKGIYRPHKSIAAAMKADWEKVGGDIAGACNRVDNGES